MTGHGAHTQASRPVKDTFNIRGNPFLPENQADYVRWRAWKLETAPRAAGELRVDIADPAHLDTEELARLRALLRRCNMAIYRLAEPAAADKTAIRRFGQQLGLARLDDNLCADEDAITSLQVVDAGRHTHYIPYSNRPLGWHTDGYYNDAAHAVRAILLHCVQDAAEGGENTLLDHELAYIHLRDADPAYVRALMAPDALTIPPNEAEGTQLRGARSGPVFTIDKASGSLHMRYSARTRNVVWKDDTATTEAVACLREMMRDGGPGQITYRLRPGEGLVSNNVLHRRAGFRDDEPGTPGGKHRLLYRARYYDRVAHTGLTDAAA